MIEDVILAELRERRRIDRCGRGYRADDGSGPRRFTPPVGCSIFDLSPKDLADFVFYVEAGFLRVEVAR